MKTHSILSLIIALAIVVAAAVTTTCLVGRSQPQENRGAVTVPAPEPQSNLNYSTANSLASQENTENPASITTEPTETSPESDNSTESKQEVQTYTVKTFNGRIGVFAGSDETPIEILDVEVAALPQEDQASLTTGIPAESKSALRRILEDYGS